MDPMHAHTVLHNDPLVAAQLRDMRSALSTVGDHCDDGGWRAVHGNDQARHAVPQPQYKLWRFDALQRAHARRNGSKRDG